MQVDWHQLSLSDVERAKLVVTLASYVILQK